ncbi:MAG TPA: PQQ-dependent sugar dehydrogenase [Gammaproteobacteria bacterium]|nr:PQQ-dependent sugar dehydrogenase [Gammaproteobacteria bacterium]
MQPPGDSSYWYVVERLDTIKRFDATDEITDTTTPVLNVQVGASGEGGLLSFAFHPDFAANGQAFLSYTVTGPDSDTLLISRATSHDGGASFDSASEKILLTLVQPFTNHDGGRIVFGPDEFFIGFGDGGSAGDPFNNAQNTKVLLSKRLRIDLDSGNPYGIPSNNPFAAGGGRCEIYTYGLPNSWQFSFDCDTGELWQGDVGQEMREEVDNIDIGGNHGWRYYEGSLALSQGLRRARPVSLASGRIRPR